MAADRAIRTKPLVFGIGLPHSGASQLAALFEGNGFVWRHHQRGKLAQSIAYARAAGIAPLTQWPKAVGFSGLYSIHKRHLPPLQVQDLVSYLHVQFPDAYFIHTHREPADWIAARYFSDDGEHRISAAWHANLQEDEMPAHWIDEQAKHRTFCHAEFEGNPKFIDINITTEPIENVCKFLSTDVALTVPDFLPDAMISTDQIEAVVQDINETMIATPPPPCDMSFARQVTDFCREKTDRGGNIKALSRTAVTWKQSAPLSDKKGETVSMVQSSPDSPFFLSPSGDAFERAQGTLNELQAHGASPPLHIDMLDARFVGTAGQRMPPRKTVAYNRRIEAKNITLWPLPGYHTLAPRGAVGGFPVDGISFDNKENRCVWLGNITGRMSPVLTPDGREQRGVYKIRDEAERLYHNSPEWIDIIADLECVPRYNVVKTLRDHPDFEVGLVLRAKWKRLAQSPAFQGLCHEKMPRTWFHKFRYVLSLAGNDTGSNFLSAASSNALILKEEDGWELFYTDAFKPWIHYVPLAEGAQDIEEKLSWARANPDAARAMVEAATALYDKFANPNNRAAYLREIAANLNKG